jgi:hypothetical protein
VAQACFANIWSPEFKLQSHKNKNKKKNVNIFSWSWTRQWSALFQLSRLFTAKYFTFFCAFVAGFAIWNSPKHNAKVLPSVPKYKEAVMSVEWSQAPHTIHEC